jgi:hypothetical protein
MVLVATSYLPSALDADTIEDMRSRRSPCAGRYAACAGVGAATASQRKRATPMRLSAMP